MVTPHTGGQITSDTAVLQLNTEIDRQCLDTCHWFKIIPFRSCVDVRDLVKVPNQAGSLRPFKFEGVHWDFGSAEALGGGAGVHMQFLALGGVDIVHLGYAVLDAHLVDRVVPVGTAWPFGVCTEVLACIRRYGQGEN